MQWIRTVGGCLELFLRRLKQLQFSTRTVMGTNAAADRSEKLTYLLGNISLYITLCSRASRTIDTYHRGIFRHVHVFCIATEEFLFHRSWWHLWPYECRKHKLSVQFIPSFPLNRKSHCTSTLNKTRGSGCRHCLKSAVELSFQTLRCVLWRSSLSCHLRDCFLIFISLFLSVCVAICEIHMR